MLTNCYIPMRYAEARKTNLCSFKSSHYQTENLYSHSHIYLYIMNICITINHSTRYSFNLSSPKTTVRPPIMLLLK